MRSKWKNQTVVLTFLVIMTSTIFAMDQSNNNADAKESRNLLLDETNLEMQNAHNENFETRSEYVDRYSQNDKDVGARIVEDEDANELKEAELPFEKTELEMQPMNNGNVDNRPVRNDPYNLNDDDVAANLSESFNVDAVCSDESLANKLESEGLESMYFQSVDSNNQKLIPTKDTECAICYDLRTKDSLVQLNDCHKQFCMKCIKKHVRFEHNKKCPLCNAMIVSINNVPLTDILNHKRYPYPVKTLKVKSHVEDPWGVQMFFHTIPFGVTRIDVNKQFDKLGVEVGWTVTKINDTSLMIANMTKDQKKNLKHLLRRGDAFTLTFNRGFFNFEDAKDRLRGKIRADDEQQICV
jgi:hypothetical protein